MVRFIEDTEEWDALMEISKSKMVIVDFTASWCPPCKYIGPIFEALSKEYPGCEFVKVDVDDNSDVAAACGISAMPTFQVFKDGAMVEKMSGANEAGLKALITKHS